ncbi:HepT-like ribonuclease domain-containing protein [Ectopseudomonas mendocina]|uniref:HepT-like ribonuclease domain-containing protein n=1 Tax=Ectopseudomonas mendocina TaxID=300 RepID=UPI003CC81044
MTVGYRHRRVQLPQEKLLAPELAERLKRAVGFHNLAAHNYEAINWGNSPQHRKPAP